MADSALAGVRVLELSQGWSSAALSGKILSDLGAEVAVIEPPSGHSMRASSYRDARGNSYAFDLIAAGKRSKVLDLQSEGQSWQSLRRLLTRADILLLDRESFRLCREHGLDQEGLARLAPRLVSCCISPFGLTGPLRDSPASELTVQAMTGLVATNGFPDSPPARVGVPVAACGGAMFATMGVLAGIYERRRSGLGQFLDISQYDCMIAYLGTLLPMYFLTGKGYPRMGSRHGMAAPWNVYQTRDGWAGIATVTQAQWLKIVEVIGQPELVKDERFTDAVQRVRNIDAMDAIMTDWTLQRSTAEVVEACDRADIPVGPVLTIEELLAEPLAKDRQLTAQFNRNGETVTVGGPLIKLSETPAQVKGPAPRLGEAEALWADAPELGGSVGVAPSGKAPPSPPLEGVTMVEVAAFTAGPLPARFLGMLGVKVIKVEPPKGEGSRHLAQKLGDDGYLIFVNNTDKYGCTLRMEDPGDRSKFLELVRQSDALLVNLAPGTLKQLGLDYGPMSDANERLIYCSTSGFGLAGQYSTRKAFDNIIQGTSGVMTVTGFPDRPPVKTGISICDLMAACSNVVGFLAALIAREHTGRGQLLDTALHDAGVWMTQELWPVMLAGQGNPLRVGNRHYRYAPHNCYQTTDGYVAIAVESDQAWHALLKVIGRPELAGDSRYETMAGRLAHVDDVDELVSKWASTRSGEEIATRCLEAGVPAATVANLPELAPHPQTVERQMIITQEHPTMGPFKVIGSPFKFSRTPVNVRRRAPLLGEDNELILGQH